MAELDVSPVPTATRVPAPAPAAPVGSIRDLICSYPWPCEQALRVVYGGTAVCPNGESGGNPNAVSPDGANLGLFQINVIHRAKVGGNVSLLLDPEVNVRVAYQIWSDQGWGPWSCKP